MEIRRVGRRSHGGGKARERLFRAFPGGENFAEQELRGGEIRVGFFRAQQQFLRARGLAAVAQKFREAKQRGSRFREAGKQRFEARGDVGRAAGTLVFRKRLGLCEKRRAAREHVAQTVLQHEAFPGGGDFRDGGVGRGKRRAVLRGGNGNGAGGEKKERREKRFHRTA